MFQNSADKVSQSITDAIFAIRVIKSVLSILEQGNVDVHAAAEWELYRIQVHNWEIQRYINIM